MRTLPALANEWSVSLDVLRGLIRRNPRLNTLGTRYGPTRVFDETEAKQIHQAYLSREAAKGATHAN
jgi:hypothetical protein